MVACLWWRLWRTKELGRNLNNTVSPDVVERFRALLIDTAGKARTNPDLAELICLDGRPLPRAGACEEPQQIQAARHLELPDLESPSCECIVCGRKYSGAWSLRQHEVDTGHFSTDDAAQLLSQREQDAAAAAEVWSRLDDALSEEF